MAQPTMKLLLFITALITISNGASVPSVRYPATAGHELPMELVFIIDSSESIGIENFETVKKFVAELVEQFTIGPSDTRIALVQYSSSVRLEFNLNRYSTKQRIIDHIKAMRYIRSSSNTGTAIRVATRQVFSDTRDGVRKVALVIVDGQPHPRDNLEEAVWEAHDANIDMYTVGIQPGTKILQNLKLVASYPDIEDKISLLSALEATMEGSSEDDLERMEEMEGSSEGDLETLEEVGEICPEPTVPVMIKTDPRCGLPREAGRCQDYTLNWYYNSEKQACLYFWYGGCDGNANRFKTQEECGNACPLTRTVTLCSLPREAGRCQDYTLNWYYNSEKQACLHFWYGGCDGNANRFKTQEECGNACPLTTTGKTS